MCRGLDSGARFLKVPSWYEGRLQAWCGGNRQFPLLTPSQIPVVGRFSGDGKGEGKSPGGQPAKNPLVPHHLLLGLMDLWTRACL